MMKVALVYDRVNKWGGAERVLLALHELYPNAPLYTAVYDKGKTAWAKVFPDLITSYLQKVPVLNKKHELLGAFVPLAFETFDLSRFDLVISVTSEAAKGVLTKPSTRHVCYCLTPTRYLWSAKEFYKDNPPKYLNIPFYKYISKPFLSYTKKWDEVACQRPDDYIAISQGVKKRIKKYYKRNSKVIHPPVELDKFQYSKGVTKKDYYLLVSRLVPYKRVDLAIDVFNQLEKQLIIVGTGSEEKKLKNIAKENISFIDHLKDKELSLYYKKAKALIFPQEEDFGIVAVEAISSGTPVVAYKKGGVLDIIEEGVNGVFFDKQNRKELAKVVKKFDRMDFSSQKISKTAKIFSKERFKRDFLKVVEND